MAEVDMKKCSACGADNATEAAVCALCGAPFPRSGYEASVEAGLKRLESEKLSFLGKGNVVSKFDPDAVAAYTPEPSDDDEDSEISDTDTLDDLTRRTEVSEQSLPSEELELSPIGNLVADEVETLFNEPEADETHDVLKPKYGTLNFAAIRSYDTKDAVNDEDDEDCDKTTAVSREEFLAQYGDSVQDLDDAECIVVEEPGENEDIEIGDETIVQEDDENLEECPTVDAGSDAAKVRLYLQIQQSQNPDKKSSSSSAPKACIMKTAQNGPKKNSPASNDASPAIDKLKQIGVFEPVMHAEVSENIQSLSELIPPSTLSPWKPDDEDANEDGSDKTCRQRPEVLEDKKYTAALARAAADAEAKKPKIIPTPHDDDPDLDSKKTMPIDLSAHPLPVPAPMPVKQHRFRPDQIIVTAPTQTFKPHRHDSPLVTTLWIALIVVLISCIFVLLYLMGILSLISPSLAPGHMHPHLSVVSADRKPSAVNVRQAIGETAFQVSMILDTDTWLNAWISDRTKSMTPDERAPWLDMAIDLYPETSSHYRVRVEDLIEQKNFSEARCVVKKVPITIRNEPEIQEIRYSVYAEDTRFTAPPRLIKDTDYDDISPLGGGSTLTFKFKKDGKNAAAFKPNQTRRQSNYRAEIAAWKLCELLECDFSVPWNRAVQIEKNTFYKMYNRSKSSKRESYRPGLKDIIWSSDQGRQVVYGTLKDWVDDFTNFPIEYTRMWKPWLSQNEYVEKFGTLKDAVSVLKNMQHTKHLYDEIIERAPKMQTEMLASQISQVLTFDFLIGNWDRFSGVKTWWGVNCQFVDNKIVSIDNGASFPSYANDKVKERFMMSERFSRHFIDALRGLDKENTLRLLFPEPSEAEVNSFERFWSQRAEVLTRIDSLSETYGIEHVLSFD